MGANAVTVRVRDAALAAATQSFTVTVANTNDAPTITSTPVTAATEDTAYSYDVNATDPDAGDTLTYSLTTAPSGMTINATTGVISWTPDQRPGGRQCRDGPRAGRGLAAATQSFTIQVSNTNNPPTASNDSYNVTENTVLDGRRPPACWRTTPTRMGTR